MKALLLALLASLPLWADEDKNLAEATVVVYNEQMPESRALAQFYARQRGILPSHLVGLNCSTEETISRAEYDQTIKTPLIQRFGLNGWWKMVPAPGGNVEAKEVKTPIVVLMRGIPLRINQEGPREQGDGSVKRLIVNESSVDSELTLLTLPTAPTALAVPNPYYDQKARYSEYKGPRILLTGRIDAPTDAICRSMITDAIAAEKTGLWGRCYLDFRMEAGGYAQGDDWLKSIFAEAMSLGIPAMQDRHATTFWEDYPMTDAAWYFGWYTGAADGPFLNPNFRFKQGAIACHIYSFSANSLHATDMTWAPTLLSHGAAVVPGNTWEPYLDGTIHLDIFFDRLARGFTVAEAAWASHRSLSWMNVVAGDPLYRPCKNRLPALQRMAREKPAKLDDPWKRLGLLAAESSSKEDFEDRLSVYLRRDPNPVMLEALASWKAKESGYEGLFDLLELAAVKYGPGADAVRCRLIQADLYRCNGRGLEVEKSLQDAIKTYQDIPAAAAMVRLLRSLQPAGGR